MRVLTVLALLSAVCNGFDANYVSTTLYNKIKTLDSTVTAMNVHTQNANGVDATATISLGVSDLINSYKLFQDHAFHMNSGTDSVFAAVALRLVSLGLLTTTSAIPPTYLPNAVTNFYNPSYTGTAITLEMLMRHTSTLSDTSFDTYRLSTPTGTVSDLTTFCGNYFTTSTTSGSIVTYSASQTIWTTTNGAPGTSGAFQYARTNTALLGCVLNNVILANTNLVTGTTKDIAGYLQESILAPLGMSSTFRLGTDGSQPRTTLPSSMNLYTGLPVVDITATGALKSDLYIHPAYPADYMFYTSTENIGRFVRSLFIDSNGLLTATGASMRASPISVSTNTNKRSGQASQSHGIVQFSGASLCATATGYLSGVTCALSDTSTIYGSYAVGQTNMWGYFCTAVTGGGTTCTTVMIAYFATTSTSTSAKDPAPLLAAATFVLSNAVSSSSGSGTTSQVTSTEFDEGLNGLWVALGVCLVIVFVLAAAYFTEYLVQPAPVPSGVTAAPPPIPQAYGHVEQGMYADGAPGFYPD